MTGRMAERVIARRRRYALFAAAADDPPASVDPGFVDFDFHEPPSQTFIDEYTRHNGKLFASVLLGHLKRGDAEASALFEGKELIACGWVVRVAVCQREFWWLPQGAHTLASAWVHPAHRGRSIFSQKLIPHRVAMHRERRPGRPLLSWIRCENTASIRGTERAGLTSVGEDQIELYAGGLLRWHRVLQRNEPFATELLSDLVRGEYPPNTNPMCLR